MAALKAETKEQKRTDMIGELYETDVAIVVAGNVDSGKSSLIGVLHTGELDDGDGLARNSVAKHKHEITTGKTSAISTRTMKTDNGKLITLIDLCGHEKYLKTTAFGITGYFPDYAIVVVAANRGIMKMTKEHLGILIYMKVPITIIITRSDIAPESIYEKTVKDIRTICRMYNKKAEVINSYKDALLPTTDFNKKHGIDYAKVVDIAKKVHTSCDYVPVITVSNKTGYYVDVMRNYISNLKPRSLWDPTTINGSIYYIDTVFNPPGIGLVLSGIVKGKSIKIGDNMYIGPVGKTFIQIRIRSIHNNNRTLISELKDHQRGCIAISQIGKGELTRQMIQKGMIVVSTEKLTDNVCYRFKAEIEILHHSATIRTNYSPIIHVGTVRQSARIIDIDGIVFRKDHDDKQLDKKIDKENLRTGDKALVTFKFKFKPEFLEIGSTFFFKEGTTRGKGEIKEIICIANDIDAEPDIPRAAKRLRDARLKSLV